MFPWNFGFHWSEGNLIFLGAFYCVVAVVAATVIAAVMRARRSVEAGRGEEVRWHAEFHDLPARDRQCRHMLTGELAYRECPNAFDCRHCETHARLVQSRPVVAEQGADEKDILGMEFPLDRLYHRGHTWVKAEPDGTVTIGLDGLGRRLVGKPDVLELPTPGTRLRTNGTGWRLCKNGAEIRVLSPVDGEVTEAWGAGLGGILRVKPDGKAFDFRHLLVPAEIRPWLLREMERLQLALSGEGIPTIADGGVPVDDIAAQYPDSDWDAVCGEMFLQG